jgi:hypothetical protein
MAFSRVSPILRRPRRSWATGAAALLLFVWTGCDRPEIQEYKVKRVAGAPAEAEAGGEPVRLLGAVFPRDGTNWFFKLIGPGEEVKQVEGEVNEFLRSVRFEGSEPPQYKAPEAWKTGRGNQFSHAAFLLGP